MKKNGKGKKLMSVKNRIIGFTKEINFLIIKYDLNNMQCLWCLELIKHDMMRKILKGLDVNNKKEKESVVDDFDEDCYPSTIEDKVLEKIVTPPISNSNFGVW